MLKNKLYLPIVLVFIFSCSGVDYPHCINEKTENVIISWGDFDTKNNNLILGYALKGNGYVYELVNLKDSVGTKYEKVSDSLFCKIYRDLKATILKTQKLNVPADTVRFIKYSNPANNYSNTGRWNNRLKAIGSKEYREIFDILNSVSPKKLEK